MVQDKSWVLALVRYLPIVWGPIVCPPARWRFINHPVEEHEKKTLDCIIGSISCIGMIVPHVQGFLESNSSRIITSKMFRTFSDGLGLGTSFCQQKLVEQTANPSNHQKLDPHLYTEWSGCYVAMFQQDHPNLQQQRRGYWSLELSSSAIRCLSPHGFGPNQHGVVWYSHTFWDDFFKAFRRS